MAEKYACSVDVKIFATPRRMASLSDGRTEEHRSLHRAIWYSYGSKMKSPPPLPLSIPPHPPPPTPKKGGGGISMHWKITANGSQERETQSSFKDFYADQLKRKTVKQQKQRRQQQLLQQIKMYWGWMEGWREREEEGGRQVGERKTISII